MENLTVPELKRQIKSIVKAKKDRNDIYYTYEEQKKLINLCHYIDKNKSEFQDLELNTFLKDCGFPKRTYHDYRKKSYSDVKRVSRYDKGKAPKSKEKSRSVGRPPNKEQLEQITTYLSSGTLQELKIYAIKNKMKIYEVVEQAIKSYIKD